MITTNPATVAQIPPSIKPPLGGGIPKHQVCPLQSTPRTQSPPPFPQYIFKYTINQFTRHTLHKLIYIRKLLSASNPRLSTISPQRMGAAGTKGKSPSKFLVRYIRQRSLSLSSNGSGFRTLNLPSSSRLKFPRP